MKSAYKSNGFTLIELVIIIVIIGILAAVAAPKFINLSSDTRRAVIEYTAGSMKETSAQVHLKAVLNHIENGAIPLAGDDILVEGSYIAGHWNSAWRFAINLT